MGFLTAVLVFLFPVGMPLVTLVAVLRVSLSKVPLATRVLRSMLLVPVLMLVHGPAVEQNGAGSFALPWWLLLGGNTRFYVWQYGLLALAACLLLSLLTSSLRAVRARS